MLYKFAIFFSLYQHKQQVVILINCVEETRNDKAKVSGLQIYFFMKNYSGIYICKKIKYNFA